jgi:hypothetical protein
MKNSFFAAAAVFTCAFAAVSPAKAQTASFAYNDGSGLPDSGTYTPGSSFTFSITLAFTAGGAVANLEGLSYWFEQSTSSAPFYFSITNRNVTGSMFTTLQTPGLTYPQSLAPQNANDLGATLPGATGVGSGNYFIANITVAIDASAVPGTYIIQNTTTGGKTSAISDDQGHSFAIPKATYTITVVPEPASVALLMMGLGVWGIFACRGRGFGR